MKNQSFHIFATLVLILAAFVFVTGCGPRPTAPESSLGDSGDSGKADTIGRHFAVALNEEAFDKMVLETPGVALVDFWAEWCGPCRAIAPAVEAVARKYDGKALVGKVDVDSQGDLAKKYNINAIPALLVFKDGEVVEEIVGGVPQDQLESAIEKHL